MQGLEIINIPQIQSGDQLILAKGLDAARTNMNSRASMTSNVSHIRFADLDLFDGRSTANSFRSDTHGTKEQSRGPGSIPTPGQSVGFSTM